MFEHLIDTKLIDEAQSRIDSVNARLPSAQERLEAAKVSLAAAQRAHANALSGESGADPHATQNLADEATKRVAVCEAAIPAISAAVQSAELDFRNARGKAYAPVRNAAILARIDATRRADAARKALGEATADWHAANQTLKSALAHGAHHVASINLDAGSASLTPVSGEFTLPTFAEDVKAFGWPVPHSSWPGMDSHGKLKQ